MQENSIPWLGRSYGGEDTNLFQYSCLDNPMDRGAWQAAVHWITNSQTQLSMHAQSHTSKERLIVEIEIYVSEGWMMFKIVMMSIMVTDV